MTKGVGVFGGLGMWRGWRRKGLLGEGAGSPSVGRPRKKWRMVQDRSAWGIAQSMNP